MIDGVRVLYEYTNISEILGLWVTIGLIALAVAFVAMMNERYIASILLLCLVSLMIGFCLSHTTTPRYQCYKVILDDVPFATLTEHYEVIRTEGEILTVRKKQ